MPGRVLGCSDARGQGGDAGLLIDMLWLLLAGIFGGVLNSIAGGGSFITFPALLFAGVPPVSANATNTFASCFGYLSGAYAFRDDLAAHRHRELPGRDRRRPVPGGGLAVRERPLTHAPRDVRAVPTFFTWFRFWH